MPEEKHGNGSDDLLDDCEGVWVWLDLWENLPGIDGEGYRPASGAQYCPPSLPRPLFFLRCYKFPSIHMERIVLRTDRLVSLNAGYRGGEVVIKPLKFKGSNLALNFATSASGSIPIESQDTAGRALPGFALEESPLVWGDDIEHTVRWERSYAGANSEEPLKRIAGKPVRLRLVMKDADLFSLRFR